jgi:superfamily II DNA or RNA helicase
VILRATVDACIHFDEAGLPTAFIREVEKVLTYANPKFFRTQAIGRSTWNIPRTMTTFDHHMSTMSLYRGTASRLVEIAAKHGIDVEWTDNRVSVPHAFKSKIKPYEYQGLAVDAAVKAGQGILTGPCASGKSVIGLLMAEKFAQRTLVCVHNTVLLNQWIEKVHDFYGIKAGIIGGGKREITPISIGLCQTLCRGVDDLKDKFGLVICDEVHHASCNTHQTVFNWFPAKYKVGISADEKRADGLEFLIYDTFGEVLYRINNPQLDAADRLMPVTIRIVETDYDDPLYREAQGANKDSVGMLTDLVADPERNALIMSLIMKEFDPTVRRSMLLLTGRVSACEYWHRELTARGMKVGMLIGAQHSGGKKAQEETRRGLISGEIDIAISNSLGEEGLDAPELARVFCTVPLSKGSMRRMNQMIGRLKRPAAGKTDAVFYYLWDRKLYAWVDRNGRVRESDMPKKISKAFDDTVEIQ